jgi:hypothetical protein
MVKIKSVNLHELASKHYATGISVEFTDESGFTYDAFIEVSGYSPQPSKRAIDQGWEPDWGMDHVEGQVQYEIALAIVEALEGKSW